MRLSMSAIVSDAARTTPPEVTIVVPTYNECERLDTLIEQVFASCDGRVSVEVIVVDDNSPDGTGARAEGLAAGRALRVIHRRGKLGLGSAVLEGFAAATADVVGVIDADLSHPPSLIPTLFGALRDRELDMAVASRYVDGGRSEGFAWSRRLLSRTACWLSRIVTPVHDAMSGFFLIRRSCLDGLRTSSHGFKIGLELLVRARVRRAGEVPYTFVGRTAGESKMSAGEAFIFARQMASLVIHRLRTAAEPVQCVTLGTAAAPVNTAPVNKAPALDEIGVP